MLLLVCLLLVSNVFLVLAAIPVENEPNLYKTVVTENGAVRGRLNSSYLHQKLYYGFKGIPYGKPPIGELRFKVFTIFEVNSRKLLDKFNTIYLNLAS